MTIVRLIRGLILAVLLSIQLVLPTSVTAASTAYSGGFFLPFDYRAGTAKLSNSIHEGGALDFQQTVDGDKRFPILAPKDGVVIYAADEVADDWNWNGDGTCGSKIVGAANYLVLGHGPQKMNGEHPFYTVYLHLTHNSLQVEQGDHVTTGQYLAKAGNTGKIGSTQTGPDAGVHLHFFGTSVKPGLTNKIVTRCDTNQSFTRTWLSYSIGNTKTVGFEEFGNLWPIFNESNGNLRQSYNNTDFETNLCDPADSNVKVILYEHIDYGGECYPITNPGQNVNVPNLGPGGLNVSSMYLNPSYFSTHFLYVFDGYDSTGHWMFISGSPSKLYTWNDRIKSLHNSEMLPNWLQEKSFSEQLPFTTNIHVKVIDFGDFDAMRVCFNGENCQETASTELNYAWNTYGWDDGAYIISIEYRRDSHNSNWANAEKYEQAYSLSDVRVGYAPCGASVDSAVQLTSGSDCIKITQDIGDLAPVGWADRSNLQACASGTGLIVWLYDGVRDQYGNFPGTPHVISNGQCKFVGGNVSSIRLRSIMDVPPIPDAAFNPDANTKHLYHFDEGVGSTLADSVGSLSGSVNASNWVSGKFGYALNFPNPNDGRAVTLGAVDVCPMTIEMWVSSSSSSGGRLAGQLGGGGNSGANKWLLSLEGKKPKLEIWSAGGSLSTTSYLELPDTGWHYIMATYDCASRQALLYLDNEQVGDFMSAVTWNSGATTFEIGAAEGIYKCNCSIDEVQISNVVRFPGHQLDADEPISTPTPTPTNTPTPSVTMFTDTGYVGSVLNFYEAGVANLSGEFVNSISSVTVASGWSTLLHEDADGGGGAVCLPTSVSDLSSYTFFNGHEINDNVESVRVFNDGSCNSWVAPTPTPTFTPTPAPTQVPEPSGNLIANWSFENLTNGWADNWAKDAESISVDTNSQGTSGTNSLHFTQNSVDTHAFAAGVAVDPGTEYLLSLSAKTSSGTGEQCVYMDEYDTGWNWVSGQWFGALPSEYNGIVSFQYTPSAGVAYAAVQFCRTANTSIEVFIDSVSLVAVASQPTATPTFTETPTPTPTVTPTPVPTNLVANPGFEATDAGSGFATVWSRDSETVTVDTGSQGNEGTNSLHFAPHTAESHAFSSRFNVSFGLNYTWSQYIKTTNAVGELAMFIDEYDVNGNWISGQWLTQVWENVNGVVSFNYTPSSASVAQAGLQYVFAANYTMEAWVDSVSVMQAN